MSILYEERLDGALPDVDRTSVLMALREHVPGLEIMHTDEEIIYYECDGLSAYRTRPLLVVLPKQMEQVTAILAVCHRLRVPVVTRGAGTGLSGGALPLEKGVLLVMARFKEILDINPVGRRARVQPGIVTWRSPRPLHRIVTTHRTLPHKSPVPLAATWQRMPAASTA
ncbi:FAD-binding protein [Escherichia coli]